MWSSPMLEARGGLPLSGSEGSRRWLRAGQKGTQRDSGDHFQSSSMMQLVGVAGGEDYGRPDDFPFLSSHLCFRLARG